MMSCCLGLAAGSYAAGQPYVAYGWGSFCALGGGIGVARMVPALWG